VEITLLWEVMLCGSSALEVPAISIFAIEEAVRYTVEDSTWCGACGRASKWAMGFFLLIITGMNW